MNKKMRLLLLGLLMLCLCSLTFSIPAEGKDVMSEQPKASADSEALTDSVIYDDADEDEDETKQIQSTTNASTNFTELDTTESEDLAISKVSDERRQSKADKHVKVSNRYNRLNNKDKRKRSRKRRPSNSKKGISKTMSKAVVKVIPYNLDTQVTYQKVDELLVLVSQYLRQSSDFSLKLATPPTNLKAKPWGYVVLETSVNVSNTQSIEIIRSKRESDDNENEGDDTELETDDEADEDEDSNDEKEESTSTVPEDSKNAPDSSLSEGEQTKTNKEETDLAVDEVEEEYDEDLYSKDETSLSNSTSQDQTAQYETPVLSQIPQPIKQSDGSQIYHLQLLNDDDIDASQENAYEPNSFKSRALDDIRSARKHGGKSGRRHQRRFKRQKARVNGLEVIRRSGNVTAGTRKGTEERVYGILLDVGPVYLTFNESAVFSLPVSRISTSVLKARLQLRERNGKLLSVRIKAVKMRPNDAVISLKVADEQPTFDDRTARLVTHLSQEISRAWNSGSLLRSVKRVLKQLLLSTESKVDERTALSQNIEEKAEKLLRDIFRSLADPFHQL